MVTQIALTPEEQQTLQESVHRGKANARTLTRARILLKCAEGWPVAQIVDAFTVSQATVYNVCQRYRAGGLERVLHDRQQVNRRHSLTGDGEALLVAIACSPVPDGHDHWTLRMLRDRLVALDVVEQIDHTTVGNVLKKQTSSPGNANSGASGNSMPLS